jgi:hypothetical protein
MWLTGRLAPDHKTIADFRKDNGTAIVCARFVALCRMMGLLTQASVAIDGSKFKATPNRFSRWFLFDCAPLKTLSLTSVAILSWRPTLACNDDWFEIASI